MGVNGTDQAGTLRPGKAIRELSLTAKYGLTSQLILDGTVNPDFSQVEADAGQVDFNLRYALYYPEKRPFFLEGREKFTMAASQVGDPLGIGGPYPDDRQSARPASSSSARSRRATRSPRSTPADASPDDGFAENGPFHHRPLQACARSEDSYVGGIWTGRFEGPRYNIVAGADGSSG